MSLEAYFRPLSTVEMIRRFFQAHSQITEIKAEGKYVLLCEAQLPSESWVLPVCVFSSALFILALIRQYFGGGCFSTANLIPSV